MTMYRNEGGLFQVLEDILKASGQPLTATELYDGHEQVRALASSANRVSDYLGNMWRNKGVVLRLPAPKTNNSSARYAYQWKAAADNAARAPGAKQYIDSLKTFSKPGIAIVDHGNTVTIELDNYIITVTKR
jgi:hypothetical protein